MENCFFETKNQRGDKVRYEMLDTFYCAATGRNYMLYTDRSVDEHGKLCVYASIYNPNEYAVNLYPIKSEQEWAYIEMYLRDAVPDA